MTLSRTILGNISIREIHTKKIISNKSLRDQFLSQNLIANNAENGLQPGKSSLEWKHSKICNLDSYGIIALWLQL